MLIPPPLPSQLASVRISPIRLLSIRAKPPLNETRFFFCFNTFTALTVFSHSCNDCAPPADLTRFSSFCIDFIMPDNALIFACMLVWSPAVACGAITAPETAKAIAAASCVFFIYSPLKEFFFTFLSLLQHLIAGYNNG